MLMKLTPDGGDLSNFFVFNSFCKNGTVFLENKNAFQKVLFRTVYNSEI